MMRGTSAVATGHGATGSNTLVPPSLSLRTPATLKTTQDTIARTIGTAMRLFGEIMNGGMMPMMLKNKMKKKSVVRYGR